MRCRSCASKVILATLGSVEYYMDLHTQSCVSSLLHFIPLKTNRHRHTATTIKSLLNCVLRKNDTARSAQEHSRQCWFDGLELELGLPSVQGLTGSPCVHVREFSGLLPPPKIMHSLSTLLETLY